MISIETMVNASLEKVWEHWTQPEHIVNWNFAADEWHCPKASNDLKKGGEFNWRMEAKDGSMGFDLMGTYDEIVRNKLITHTMSDGRKVEIRFEQSEGGVKIIESFEPEGINPHEMQRNGWQAILDNFKQYVESNVKIDHFQTAK